MIKLVPLGIPANIITIISNSFMYLALALAYLYGPSFKWNFVIIPILILLYLIGDHLDGMQAKRTQTGSALGEFCDHFLDTFNNGILLMIIFLLFGITEPTLIALLITISYLAHASIFYEQYKSGWLIFERFGSLEAVFVSLILILSGYFSPLYNFYVSEALSGFSFMEVFMLISAVGAISTYIKTLGRVKRITYAFWLFCLLIVAITFYGSRLLDTDFIFIILTLYSGVYIGNLMRGHLADGIERSPDLFTPMILSVYFFIDKFNQSITQYIIVLYLSIKIILIVYKTFKPLKKYWVWKNPSLVTKD
ncbi:CDP-alcohol phosphatidyltransferase family protein [Fulvivirgaceae bacterium BMA10]|uniref:CDP-alcohol phosphatidyltransferase family protein n=1 Tax=Splendidivirga corallicola TaxID=3051826 RepID=A0ABT8KVH6_9BACT|nr:CDP-alcohol phosphatidyltransferase family protein [Fulvivirgaceae bacterium BMA10]